ncbi:aspartyl-phosphate phosphatase Spo0E family protein [Mesobacillus foraminis]|uniref:Spo0E family sporulation regulatory protein-aspartic acid phosphatase n=1 Tax=Mesobacillus foraminis TaxID=279826 RepID=UPI001BE5BC5A|nr:aspartyl-phosphate phosphatase Spo0E family protein [Mesobacillus foraminis]MBT2758003.1 aspartyl-phosphate phosphatase Spo0E family protein [Mesobacillus foraminis]
MDKHCNLTFTELSKYIEFLRQDLITKGMTLGFNHDKTLQASRELDYYILEYQLLGRKKAYPDAPDIL